MRNYHTGDQHVADATDTHPLRDVASCHTATAVAVHLACDMCTCAITRRVAAQSMHTMHAAAAVHAVTWGRIRTLKPSACKQVHLTVAHHACDAVVHCCKVVPCTIHDHDEASVQTASTYMVLIILNPRTEL